MSLIFTTKPAKDQFVDMAFSLVRFLTFHGLKHNDHMKITQHFAALPLSGDLDVSCKLQADETGNTTITIYIIPRAK